MKLIFVRHAKAQGRYDSDKEADFVRPLTNRGIFEFQQNLNSFKEYCSKVDSLTFSPLVRSLQTAELFSRSISCSDFHVNSSLEYDAPPEKLLKVIHSLKFGTHAFVGHEPHLGKVIALVTNQKSFKLRKGSICLVDDDEKKILTVDYLNSQKRK